VPLVEYEGRCSSAALAAASIGRAINSTCGLDQLHTDAMTISRGGCRALVGPRIVDPPPRTAYAAFSGLSINAAQALLH